MSFGEKIRKKREKLRMTQEELSFKINEELSRQSISKWERGESFPDVENLLALAKTLGMTLDDMFADELSAIGAPSTEVVSEKKIIAVKNELPVICRTRNGGKVSITSITAELRHFGTFHNYNICFKGTVLEEPENPILDEVLYLLLNSNGEVIDRSDLDVESIGKGESFSLRRVHLLHSEIGSECEVKFV